MCRVFTLTTNRFVTPLEFAAPESVHEFLHLVHLPLRDDLQRVQPVRSHRRAPLVCCTIVPESNYCSCHWDHRFALTVGLFVGVGVGQRGVNTSVFRLNQVYVGAHTSVGILQYSLGILRYSLNTSVFTWNTSVFTWNTSVFTLRILQYSL